MCNALGHLYIYISNSSNFYFGENKSDHSMNSNSAPTCLFSNGGIVVSYQLLLRFLIVFRFIILLCSNLNHNLSTNDQQQHEMCNVLLLFVSPLRPSLTHTFLYTNLAFISKKLSARSANVWSSSSGINNEGPRRLSISFSLFVDNS